MRILACLLVALTQALLEIPVQHLIQFDYEGSPYGSQVASFNFLGAHFQNEAEVPRKISLIHSRSLTLETLENTISLKPSALLIILAANTGLSKEIQTYLGANAFHFPIYFTDESPELMEVYESLLATGEQSIDSDQLQFSVSSDEKAVIKNLQQENYYGFVYEYSESLPTIALVTYYDAFSIIPERTSGTDANGSGLVALIELIRLFQRLYAQSPASYNLLFILAGSGTTNFQGLKHWLATEEPELQQIRGGISFALCLDTIGLGSGLHMHVSRFHKEGESDLMSLYSHFNSTAEKNGVNLQYNKKKINMADPFTPWQHEAFVKNKIVSATISHLEHSKTSVVDHSLANDLKVDVKVLEKNIRFIGESLAMYLYGLNEASLFSKSDVFNASYIEELVVKVQEYNRFPSKLTPGSKFLAVLQEELKALGVGFKAQKFPATEVSLYKTKQETLMVYKVKPAMLDLYLFLSILGYLVVLWAIVKTFGGSAASKKKSN